MADSQRFLVPLVEIVRHTDMMTDRVLTVSGTCVDAFRRQVLRHLSHPSDTTGRSGLPQLSEARSAAQRLDQECLLNVEPILRFLECDAPWTV